MRITIEDLEALKELNDELEENHIETEKALQAEIGRSISIRLSYKHAHCSSDDKDIEVNQLQRKIETVEETCHDLEDTISQFRELVMTLQQELDSLRTQSQTATEESAKAASQTAAMMSLNLKLQSSASKSHARAIEFELKKIEAREAQELLSIVQVCTLVPYLIDWELTRS
jgi:dynactin 1